MRSAYIMPWNFPTEWIVLNAQIREMCKVMNGVDERIDEVVLWWFGYVETMEKDRIAKRVYAEECAGICSVCRLWKRWIDTVRDCLRKRSLDFRQARRMVQNRSEWSGVVRVSGWGIAQGMNPWPLWDATVICCHSYMKCKY